jgi:hypothetical protein
MKKKYSLKKHVILVFLFLFSLNLASFAQSKSLRRSDVNTNKNSTKQVAVPNFSKNGNSTLGGSPNTTFATACDSYTWAQNGQTYTSTGLYTAPDGITQSFNNFTLWANSGVAEGALIGSNTLSGITVTNPTPVTVTINGVTASISAPGGMYAAPNFVGSNSPNDVITITFSSPVYGATANIFATDIADVVIPGTITTTYFNGATSLFADTRAVTADTESYGYFSTTGVTSIQLSVAATTPVVNRYISFRNLSIATNPTAFLNLTINNSVTPTFTQVAPICVGGTIAALPTTSNNGITGAWSPAIDSTVTTTYTFTPDPGQCVTSTVVTMTIAVNPNPIITFGANPFPVCAGTSTVLTAITTNVTPTVNFVNTSSVNQSLNIIPGSFGVPVISPLSANLVLAPSNGCAAFASGLFAGKIALIQRGTCSFAIKAQNAQNAGAIGVIIYNNVAGNLNGGVAPGITIPVYGTTQANGLALIAAMTANEVAVTLNPSPVLTYLWSNGSTVQTTNTGVLNVDTDFSVTVTNTATGCSTLQTVTVPVTANIIPTFTQVAAICNGGTLSPLPTTSDNAIVGTWSPALDNTTTTTYTFTPTPVAGQCLGTATMTITVNQPTAPVFTQAASICVGGTIAALPTTSNNGFTGTWSPAIDSTVTTTYTFTPDAGQCVNSTVVTMTVAVNPLPAVTFGANPFPVCAGTSTVLTAITNNIAPTVNFVDGSSVNQSFNMNAAAFGVPVTSPLAGTLANAPSNGCVAFTPGLFTGKIALIQRGGCTFVTKVLNAQNAGAIGVILYNNVAGPIIPAGVDPLITIPVYGITQANGLALIAAMTANEVAVTLNPAPPLTYLWSTGDTTQTTNTGVLNVDTDFSVTVTNTATGCSTLQTVTVPVTPNTIPTFTQVAAICNGGTLSPLPTTSDNTIAGTWSPALDNTTTTTYTFTPTPVAGQCLGTATMTITVNSTSPPPTGDANQTISVSNPNDATLASLVVSPVVVVWYGSLADAQNGTNPLPSSTIVTNGSTYYAVNVVGSCPSTPLAVTVTVTLGNDEFDNINFSFYPNPTSSILNISYSKIISEVSVSNVLGQLVLNKKTNSSEVQIDLSPLAEAPYFVKVISEGKEKTIKVIKKN